MIWSAITAAGIGWLCKIDGTLDSQLYLQFLKDELELTLDYAAKTLSLRKEQLVFQHDNDPKHTAKAVREYLNEQNYEVLEWPAHSPDLNPIEHMWALFKRKLNEYESPPKGVQELYERVVDIWYNQITREDRLKVIDSMPDRIQANNNFIFLFSNILLVGSIVYDDNFVVPKRHKFLSTIPVRNKQRGPRQNPVTLKALKNKTRFGSRSFPFGMNAVRATKTLAQLSKPS
ncbi:hypothetical protein G6F68_011427 [Rhizopus microsporus]|nr:hypothetical protein G6F69_009213 [Rhizopus microsporus]KAG1253240.1 hypothetical protein G6F68_011427 [Rhizopus microsporus]